MQRSERKNSRLRARVEELSHELARVEDEMRSLSRATRHPDRETAARRLRQVAEEQEKARTTPVARAPAPPEPVAQVVAAEAEVPAGGEPGPKNMPDPRFANYFVTGGLHSVRPLRQERRVQRNRAILMLLLAIFLLYGVLSLLF